MFVSYIENCFLINGARLKGVYKIEKQKISTRKKTEKIHGGPPTTKQAKLQFSIYTTFIIGTYLYRGKNASRDANGRKGFFEKYEYTANYPSIPKNRII